MSCQAQTHTPFCAIKVTSIGFANECSCPFRNRPLSLGTPTFKVSFRPALFTIVCSKFWNRLPDYVRFCQNLAQDCIVQISQCILIFQLNWDHYLSTPSFPRPSRLTAPSQVGDPPYTGFLLWTTDTNDLAVITSNLQLHQENAINQQK